MALNKSISNSIDFALVKAIATVSDKKLEELIVSANVRIAELHRPELVYYRELEKKGELHSDNSEVLRRAMYQRDMMLEELESRI